MAGKLDEASAADLATVLDGLIDEGNAKKAAIVAPWLDDAECIDPERWLLLGRQAILAEDWDLAEKRLRKARELGSENPRVPFEMARVMQMKGDDGQAVAWAKKTISEIPLLPYGYFLLAEIHDGKGRTDEAAAVLRKITNSSRFSDKVRADARKRLAETLENAGRFGEAVPLLRKAVQLEADDAGLWTDLGHCLSRSGDVAGALEAFQTAAGISVTPDALYNVGDALLALGRREEAVAALEKTARLNPGHVMVNYDLGLAYYEEGRYADGAAASARALREDPEMEFQRSNPALGANRNLGLCLMECGKYEKALACFDKNIALIAKSYYNKGLTLYRMKRTKEAIACFDKVLEFEPNDLGALNLKGQALDEDGKFAEAVASLRKALKIDPKYALGYYDLGVILARKKDKRDEAMACFRKALALDLKKPFPAQAHYSIACLHAVAGRKKEALEMLAKALEMGYRDRKHIAEDTDWDGLRKDPDFKGILSKHFGK